MTVGRSDCEMLRISSRGAPPESMNRLIERFEHI